ncbi:MAG TPA: hypothetical protein VFM14_09535 [Gemmatimonadales bacterium]|nr:hypothetical protein [Gemmatimonadales bacterium]
MSQTTIQQARFRRVEADVLLPAGWLMGTFVVPETQSLQDFLEHAGAFLKLTDARVPGHVEIVPFFAVQRGAVELIAPRQPDDRIETPGSAGHTAPWSISCLFHRGAVHGSLDFLMNLRLSDYLRQQTGFLLLRDASWVSVDTGRDDAPRQWPMAFVNVPQVNGISEAVDQRGRGHPGKLAPSEFELLEAPPTYA